MNPQIRREQLVVQPQLILGASWSRNLSIRNASNNVAVRANESNRFSDQNVSRCVQRSYFKTHPISGSSWNVTWKPQISIFWLSCVHKPCVAVVSHLFVRDIDRSAEDDPLHNFTAGRSGQGACVAIVAAQRRRQHVFEDKRFQESLFF